jgi:hypothetical protein
MQLGRAGYWDQAAIQWLVENNPEVAERYHFVHQRLLNSYPETVEAGGCWGAGWYKPGDLVLHLAGGYKWSKFQAMDFAALLESVPITAPVQQQAEVYALAPCQPGNAEPQFNIDMVMENLSFPQGNSTPIVRNLSESYCVAVHPMPRDAHLGWPFPLPNLLAQLHSTGRPQGRAN